MTGIDTNIIVRFLTGDDAEQFTRAKKVFADHNLFIADTVLLETEWVLRFAYKFSSQEINAALLALLGLSNISVTNPIQLRQALELHKQGLDFADALHLAKCEGQATAFLTFDQHFIKAASHVTSCPVKEP